MPDKSTQEKLKQADIDHIKKKMHDRSMIEVPESDQENPSNKTSSLGWSYIATNWKALLPIIEQNWPRLSHDELSWADANYDRLVSIIEKRYGFEASRAREDIANWIASLNRPAQP